MWIIMIQSYSAFTTTTISFQSIRRAHVNVKPAEIFYSEGELHDANINRSPTSYLANPESERAKWVLPSMSRI